MWNPVQEALGSTKQTGACHWQQATGEGRSDTMSIQPGLKAHDWPVSPGALCPKRKILEEKAGSSRVSWVIAAVGMMEE